MDSGLEDNAHERDARRGASERDSVPTTDDESWRLLVQTTPVAIFHADLAGNCIYVNEYWSELTGRPVRTALGEGWKEAVHPDDVPRIIAEWERCLRLGIQFCLHFRYVRPDGTIVWALGRTVEERDASGAVKGYVSSVTNITDIYEKLEALQRSDLDRHKPGRKKRLPGARILKRGARPADRKVLVDEVQSGRPGASLTPRELEIFKLLAMGKTNREVGRLLEISVKTAETHRARIRRKLGVDSAAALVRYAIRNGFISP